MVYRKKKRKPGWQQRKPPGPGPRLLDGEVPEGSAPEGGILSNFSWKIALGMLALGILVALVAQYAC